MAASLSKTMIIGNLGADPEVRYLGNGSAVTNLTVATTESWKDRTTGQKVERTEWHRVVIYGGLAEVAGKYSRKGSKVFIEGRNQTREWEKDGVKRYTTEIIVDMKGQFQLLDSKPSQESMPSSPAQRPARQPAQQQAQQPTQQSPGYGAMPDYPPGFDEDIPFRPLHFLTGL